MKKIIIKSVVLISLITSSIKEIYARGYHNPENDWFWLFIIGLFLSCYLIEYLKEKVEQYVNKLKKKHKDNKKRKNINETINESEVKEIVDPKIIILRSEVINLINQLTLTDDTKILWTNLVNNMKEEEKLLECKKKCIEFMNKEK